MITAFTIRFAKLIPFLGQEMSISGSQADKVGGWGAQLSCLFDAFPPVLLLQPNKAQKALLKEKFKVGAADPVCPDDQVSPPPFPLRTQGFNTELEELCRVHGQYSIPDSRLRQRVREDNIELLGPLYSEFFRVYVYDHACTSVLVFIL